MSTLQLDVSMNRRLAAALPSIANGEPLRHPIVDFHWWKLIFRPVLQMPVRTLQIAVVLERHPVPGARFFWFSRSGEVDIHNSARRNGQHSERPSSPEVQTAGYVCCLLAVSRRGISPGVGSANVLNSSVGLVVRQCKVDTDA